MHSPRRLPITHVGVFTLVLAFAAASSACTDDAAEGNEMGETSDEALSHADDIQPIWDANCVAGCHEPGGIVDFPDLSGDAYDKIVDVSSKQAPALALVETNASDMSYIVDKLRGTQVDAGGGGGTMPSGASMLSEADIGKIEAWIDSGAMP